MLEHDKKSILVIEDEIMVQMLVVDVLKDLGFATLEAKDAKTALPILQGNQPLDLMITDIGLPGMNGWDLAKLARENRPALKILYLTGYEGAENGDVGADGLEDVMIKPFDMGEFEAKVAAMLAPPAL
jgi:DNA-binding response OmpR family regulator